MMRQLAAVVVCVLGAVVVVTSRRLPAPDGADEKVDAFVRALKLECIATES